MTEIKKSFFPVFEWTRPSSAILGGFSLSEEKLGYNNQYLSYLEELSNHIPVLYFADDESKKNIESGIKCSNIIFYNYKLNSIWIRDYAPIWLQCSDTLDYKLVNFPYGANHFGKNEQDDNFSLKLSEVVGIPLAIDFPRKQIPFYFDGGNIFVDEDRNCFTSIRIDDPPIEYREKLLAHINCDKIIAMHAIPGEPTGHVDTFMKILPNKKVLLAKYEKADLNLEMIKNKSILENLNYEVIKVSHSDMDECTNWSYLNSLVVEEK